MKAEPSQFVLAIDPGGSKVRAAVVDESGNVAHRRQQSWRELTADGVVRQIVEMAESLVRTCQECQPTAIGVTIPGLADPEKGLWVEASFSGIRDLPLRDILEKKFGLPVALRNDAQACAMAERRFGGGRDVKHFLYLTISNGVGGAIWAGEGIYPGGWGNAGEIGHVTVVKNGRPCKCGSRGCLEMYAAGPGIVRNYMEQGGAAVDAMEIARKAEAGEPAAVKTFQLEGEYLGMAIAAACNLLNPQKVILGGGVSLAFSLFEAALRETVRAEMYCGANPNLEIIPSPLGENGGLLAAATLGFSYQPQA